MGALLCPKTLGTSQPNYFQNATGNFSVMRALHSALSRNSCSEHGTFREIWGPIRQHEPGVRKARTPFRRQTGPQAILSLSQPPSNRATQRPLDHPYGPVRASCGLGGSASRDALRRTVLASAATLAGSRMMGCACSSCAQRRSRALARAHEKAGFPRLSFCVGSGRNFNQSLRSQIEE